MLIITIKQGKEKSLLERQPNGDAVDAGLEGAVQQLAERDFAAAETWIDTQASGQRRDRILQRLVFVRASQDPGDAARLAFESFGAEVNRDDALASIARLWGERNLRDASEWAHTLAGTSRARVDSELAILRLESERRSR